MKRANAIDPVMIAMEKKRGFQTASDRVKFIDSMIKEYCSAVNKCEDDEYFQSHTKIKLNFRLNAF